MTRPARCTRYRVSSHPNPPAIRRTCGLGCRSGRSSTHSATEHLRFRRTGRASLWLPERPDCSRRRSAARMHKCAMPRRVRPPRPVGSNTDRARPYRHVAPRTPRPASRRRCHPRSMCRRSAPGRDRAVMRRIPGRQPPPLYRRPAAQQAAPMRWLPPDIWPVGAAGDEPLPQPCLRPPYVPPVAASIVCC